PGASGFKPASLSDRRSGRDDMPLSRTPGLTARQVDSFIADGFVRLEGAFSPDLARTCRDALWADSGLSPDDPAGWTQPVIRIGWKSTPPFVAAANTPRLQAAYDALVGACRWLPPQ